VKANPRVSAIPLSETIALDTRAKELIAAGRDVLNLSAGEPDFDAPQVVRDAARAAVDGGQVRYTPAPGRKNLREAIAKHLTGTRGVPYRAEEVIVCHSAKHALSGSFLGLIHPGDEVLLSLPAWVSYVEQIKFAGGVPVGAAPREDLGPAWDALEAAVTPRTKGIVWNSPSNPSGYVATHEETQRLVDFAEAHDLWILSDEIYRRLTYGGARAVSPVEFGDAARARTVIVDGASKAYAMTGYRIGFLAAPAEFAGAIGRLHSQLTGSPNAISQDAYLAALVEEPTEVAGRVIEFERRRNAIVSGLRGLGLEVPEPGGAFYVFARVTPYLDERKSAGFCEDLLETEGLAIVPGSAFGTPDYVRFSYAASLETLQDAVDRMGRFLAKRR